MKALLLIIGSTLTLLLFYVLHFKQNATPTALRVEEPYPAATLQRLQAKYNLVDVSFDTECLYAVGDLSALLTSIIAQTLPEKHIHVAEHLSSDQRQYIVTLTTKDTTVVFTAATDSDWLPDHFFTALENLPAAFGSEKRLYSINPAMGLTGQEAWYFCGTEAHLKAARAEGLPLVFPQEGIIDTPEYKRLYGSQ
ncbi:hypothetical protein [Hymenobacter sp. GOD-10R]|uniref:hypothetical protein n=1 Tax=Hymenobacter sp. GOD-10R TaxID=3093922 RepID=UPI002D77234A|nr:hypothetical protein [Hymenobacter sp. GOD-10R]WRQ31634.1 hypothetical protein SD425_27770 [Hymenobacter sp. GOD-10R]